MDGEAAGEGGTAQPLDCDAWATMPLPRLGIRAASAQPLRAGKLPPGLGPGHASALPVRSSAGSRCPAPSRCCQKPLPPPARLPVLPPCLRPSDKSRSSRDS